MRRSIVFSLSCAVFFAGMMIQAPSARAGEAEIARSHFEAGKKLRDEGDCARAIPEFDKSLAADRSIGAFYNLGFCHEQLQHKQEAYEAYKHAQQLASQKKDDRLREISGALAALLETPHIRLVLPQQLPEGIQVRVDDQLVPETFYQTEMVVFTKNTKTHSVVVTAPGWEERRENVDTKSVKAIELRRPQATTPTTPAANTPPTKTKWSYWHYGAVGAIGAGVLTAAIGGIFFIKYLGDRSDLDERLTQWATASKCGRDLECPPGTTLSGDLKKQQGDLKDENNQLEKDVKVQALAPVIIGSVFIVAGLAIFIIAPREPVETAPKPTERGNAPSAKARLPLETMQLVPHVSPQQQGLSIVGTF